LRESADGLAGLGVQEIAEHYETLVGEYDQPPVLIGHSFGGLIVVILLDRGLGCAGVAISPAGPKGIPRLPLSELKLGSPVVGHPSKWHGVVTLTLAEVRLCVCEHV
jgi:alpha-beta hydrolase superfamily lysophospholipase